MTSLTQSRAEKQSALFNFSGTIKNKHKRATLVFVFYGAQERTFLRVLKSIGRVFTIPDVFGLAGRASRSRSQRVARQRSGLQVLEVIYHLHSYSSRYISVPSVLKKSLTRSEVISSTTGASGPPPPSSRGAYAGPRQMSH